MYDYNINYNLSGLKLAQAYIPLQKYVSSYPPEEAIKKGTIFPELDIPYIHEKTR
ncbi:MAG: spore coat associated protein CotJA [Minisyncoccia bacterium]